MAEADPRGGLTPGPRWLRLFSLVRPYAPALAFASVLVVAGSAVGLVAPRVAGFVVDAAVGVEAPTRLDRVALALVALFALRGGLSYAEHYLLRATGARLLYGLRRDVHTHLLALGPSFYGDRPVGELLSRIGSDLERIRGTLTSRVPEGGRAAITFLGAGVILFTMHGKLAWVALAPVPVVTALSYVYGRRLQSIATRSQDAVADSSAAAGEALAGLATLQAFRGEDEERVRYRRHLDRLLGVQLEGARTVGLFTGLLQFVGFASFALVLWYGGRLVAQGGELSPGELTSYLIYTFAIAGSISSLGSLYAGIRELRGASARIFEILDEAPAVREAPFPVPLSSPRGELMAENLWFRYPGSEEWALRGVSMSAQPGELVALVGPSGAGKSTLFALIQRFYDPQRGHLAIDDLDIRTLSLASIRREVAAVSQDVFLFSRSVADNIRLGRPDAGEGEVRAAAEAADADAFIRELPGGYGAEVGERGIRLSAGERQRIGIARSLLQDPAILLLDEFTSALDAETEEAVQQAIVGSARQRTTIIVAHRLATARLADRILVVEEGRIAASGPHAELVETSDLYRRYWELQARGAAGE